MILFDISRSVWHKFQCACVWCVLTAGQQRRLCDTCRDRRHNPPGVNFSMLFINVDL